MTGKDFLDELSTLKATELFTSLYGKDGAEIARLRYLRLIEEFLDKNIFPAEKYPETGAELHLFSVPGRSELGGNHTDHNHGKVLAASIHLDAVAIVAPRQDNRIFFRSVGHRDVMVDLTDLSLRKEETGSTEALIRGVAAEMTAQGTPVKGFSANADNMVLAGSGLSSSAAIEVLFAKIFDDLFCGGKRSAIELAKIAQKAENVYFGKPCGLMDQIACASGGAAAIDFKDIKNPELKKINFNPAAAGIALCVVDTRGKHSSLTPDYAAIPGEMKNVAAFFGKTVLRDLDEEIFMSSLAELRKITGDRAILRAIHFFNENKRLDAMLAALEKLNSLPPEANTGEIEEALGIFLDLVKKSGDSSMELLQNIYSTNNPSRQGLSLALALTREFLNRNGSANHVNGVCRVHGGGFAGTIQAYVPTEKLEDYRKLMEGLFGKGALTVLRIRPLGAIEIIL